MREREGANRTRAAGNRDEVEGVVAISLNLFRDGAVGFVDWLDLSFAVALLANRICFREPRRKLSVNVTR